MARKGREGQGPQGGRQGGDSERPGRGGQDAGGQRSSRAARRQSDLPPARRRRQQVDTERQERVDRHRAAAERGNRNLIIGGVVAVVIIALGIIGFGIYQTQIKPLNKTVLRVGETEYSLAHLERRMRLTQIENPTFAQGGQILLQLPNFVLDELEQEATLLEAAATIDVTVTEEDVDNEIKRRGGLAEDVEASVFAEEFRSQVKASPLHADEYRQYLRGQLLEEKVNNYFAFLAPTSEPQVRSRWIAFDDQDEADAALIRLDDGENFEALARELSIDSASAEAGGLVEWRPRGTFPFGGIEGFLFEEAARKDHSEVFPAGGLFYLVRLLDKEDDRELDGDQRRVVGQREMADWVGTQTGTLDFFRDLSAEDANRALDDVL